LDSVLLHLARRVGHDLVAGIELNAIARVGQDLDHKAFELDEFLFGHFHPFRLPPWGWKDSNLQPGGYERTLRRQIMTCPLTFVAGRTRTSNQAVMSDPFSAAQRAIFPAYGPRGLLPARYAVLSTESPARSGTGSEGRPPDEPKCRAET